MLISVAMCTYNGEKYIEQQLDSILQQSIKPDEIIICDDGSTDSTPSIINKYIDDDTIEIKFFVNEKNLGSSKNFEKAIQKCSGEIIFLSDQDDVWELNKVEKFLEVFSNDNVGVVFSNATLIDENGEIINNKLLWDVYIKNKEVLNKISTKKAFKMLVRRNYITGATMAFRRNCFKENINLSELWVQDHEIVLLISQKFMIVPIRECLTKYRIHPNQQIGIGRQSKLYKIKQRFKNKEEITLFEIARVKELEQPSKMIIQEYKSVVTDYLEFLELRKQLRQCGLLKRIKIVLKNTEKYRQYDNMTTKMLVDILNI